MAILKLFSLDTLKTLAQNSVFGELNLSIHNLSLLDFFVLFVINTPKLDYPVVSWKQLHTAILMVTKEIKSINFLIQLDALQVVKLWLVWLDLTEISVIEVARVLQLKIPKDDDATTPIPNGEILSALVKSDGCQDIWLGYVRCIAFAETINVNPVCVFSKKKSKENYWL